MRSCAPICAAPGRGLSGSGPVAARADRNNSSARWRYVSTTLPELVPVGERTRIQLCGRLSVELDGVELVQSLRGKQVPLLLAYLVLNRARPVGRDELIGALWPETAPRSQDAAVRTL